MGPNKAGIRISFLLTTLVIALILGTPIPFLTRIIKEIPLVSLFLGEVSLVFLVILASFPKAGIKEIVTISSQFLIVIGVCFGILSLIPIAPEFRLFSFGDIESGIPNLVSVNIIGVIALNFVVCFLLNIELKRKKHANAPAGSFSQRRLKNKNFNLAPDIEGVGEVKTFGSELKKDVNSLFDLYLKEYEDGQIDINLKLENIEKVLLENINLDITGAMCIDKDGAVLHDTVFQWSGYPKENMLDLFQRNNQISKDLGTGVLCQMLFKDGTHWYIIAKFRGNYLILQSEKKNPSPLLETSYKVFKALKLA